VHLQSVAGRARRSVDWASSLVCRRQQFDLLLMVSTWVSHGSCRRASLKITACQKHVIFKDWDAHKQGFKYVIVSQVNAAYKRTTPTSE